MDFRETLNCQDYTKLDKFSKQLRALNDYLETWICLKCVGLCSEINGYKTGFMDALTLLNSEPDLQSFKELFEEWWVDYEFDQRINVLLGQYPYTNFEERIDYELKEEYGTSSRKEVAKIMIDDLETSSEDEAKKLFLQEILSLEKRSNNID